MKSATKLKKSLAIFACITLAIPAHSKISDINSMANNDASEFELQSDPKREPVVTKGVLLTQNEDGEIAPVCAVDTIDRPELVPTFANNAPKDFQSSINPTLRNCNEDEIDIVKYQASIAIHQNEAQFAALPAVVVAGIIICSAATTSGAVIGATHAKYKLEIDGRFPIVGATIGSVSMGIGRSTIGTGPMIAGFAGGGFLGYVCSGLGTLGGYFGMKYFME